MTHEFGPERRVEARAQGLSGGSIVSDGGEAFSGGPAGGFFGEFEKCQRKVGGHEGVVGYFGVTHLGGNPDVIY